MTKINYCLVDLDISPTDLCLKWDCDPLVSLTTVAMSPQMFDSHNYRTRPDVLWCCFLFRNNWYVSIIVLFPSLMEIIPVQHLFDGEVRGNNKALDVCLKGFEMSPKAPENTPSSPWSCSCGKYMFVDSQSVSHHALQLSFKFGPLLL